MCATFVLVATDSNEVGYAALYLVWGLLVVRNLQMWCCAPSDKPDLKDGLPETLRETAALKQSIAIRESSASMMSKEGDDDYDPGDDRNTETVLDDIKQGEAMAEAAFGSMMDGAASLGRKMRQSAIGVSVSSEATNEIELKDMKEESPTPAGSASLKAYMEGHDSTDINADV